MTERKCLNLIQKDWEIISSSSFFNEALQWYDLKNQFCLDLSKEYDYKLQQITGLYSAFSPLKSVSENERILKGFLKGKRHGHTNQQINKAELILQTENIEEIDVILKGLKTMSFHRNLYNPMDKNYVCNDRHVLKYFNSGNTVWMTTNRYKMYSNAIFKFSKKVNLVPSQIQSSLWYYSKQQYGNNV
jgi:hypothetical protein